MTAALLLFDATGDALGAAVGISFGIAMIVFMLMFFFVLWLDTRNDKQRWKLSDEMHTKDLELQKGIWDAQRELRQMIYDAKSEVRKEITDSERHLWDALAKVRADLPVNTSEDRERESMDALWTSLMAANRERAERALERLERKKKQQQPKADGQQAAPGYDIDEGLKRLEQTIANLTPSDDATMQRIDASLKRTLENLKRSREIQRSTDALLEGE